MLSFMKSVLKVATVFLVVVICVVGIVWGIIIKDKPLNPELVKVLDAIENPPEIPLEENRFYYLQGFDLPPLTQLLAHDKLQSFGNLTSAEFGKKWLDARDSYFKDPRNTKSFPNSEANIYIIQQILPEAVEERTVNRHTELYIKEEYTSAAELIREHLLDKRTEFADQQEWMFETARNLFSQIEEPDFAAQLQEWFECVDTPCDNYEKWAKVNSIKHNQEGKKRYKRLNVLSGPVKQHLLLRYTELRQVKKTSSKPHWLHDSSYAYPSVRGIIDSHTLYLLDLLGRYLEAEGKIDAQTGIFEELVNDMNQLHGWYKSVASLYELAVVRGMMIADMRAGIFLLQQEKENESNHIESEKLIHAFQEVEETLLHTVPQQVIYQTLYFNVYMLNEFVENIDSFPEYWRLRENEVAIIPVEETIKLKIMKHVPGEIYKIIVHLFLRQDETKNKMFEAYSILRNQYPYTENGEEFLKDVYRSTSSLSYRMYNPLGKIYLHGLGGADTAFGVFPSIYSLEGLIYPRSKMDKVRHYKKSAMQLQQTNEMP